MTDNKYNIGDEVYHITPDSEKGIIIDITYSFSMDRYAYTVATTWNTEYICAEHELTDHKNF